MSIRQDLSRVIRVPQWKHHLGRAGTATAIAFVGASFGLPLFWSCLLGGIVWPFVHEGYGLWRGPRTTKKCLDHAAHLVQHQPLWVIYLVREGKLLEAAIAAKLLGLAYLATLIWSEP